ncbi:CFEM domain-containing protein [Seiridium cupressi]
MGNWRKSTAVAVSSLLPAALGQASAPNVTSTSFLQMLPDCAVAACASTSELLILEKAALLLEDDLCQAYPKESRGDVALIASILTFAISIPALVARCASRLKYSHKLWSDDYMSITATVFLLGLAAMQIVCCQRGFGMHQWEIETIENSEILLLLLFISQIFYIVVQCIAKLAILLLYRRIFNTGAGRWFRWAVKGLIGLCFVIGILFSFLILFQCYPIAAAWDITITDFKCLDFAPILFAGSFVGIVTDIVLVLLPIPELRKLQISGRKRIGVGIMFAIALLGVVASVIRLQYLVRLNWSYDLSWDETDVVVWSLIELLCIVVCGNLPALRPFVGALIPKISATWRRSTQSLKRSTFSSSRYTNAINIGDDAKELTPHTGPSPVSLHRLDSVKTDRERSESPESYSSLPWPATAKVPAMRY